MIENQELISELQKLLKWKKSRRFYAEKLGLSEQVVDELIRELKGTPMSSEGEVMSYVSELEDIIVKFDEDLRAQKAELVAEVGEQIKTLDELVEKCKIDITIWNIDRYVQNFWGNSESPKWQVKAWLSKKSVAEVFGKDFLEFLKTYEPNVRYYNAPEQQTFLQEACLIINKQDQHLNKFDINGDNDINKRCSKVWERTYEVLLGASKLNHINKIHYIIGSDQFNSEWMGTTTKGTRQENILPYHEGFNQICNHEIEVIDLLAEFSGDLEITYVPGNHDEYVGWHLINWLQAYYKDEPTIKFDSSPKCTKYVQYGKSAIMFNHGDAIKPAKLAAMFPIQFRENWSSCDSYYIFTGDKHHELSMELTGIKFYQIPALSQAKSSWDDKNGHICDRPEISAFIIEKDYGMTSILKKPL